MDNNNLLNDKLFEMIENLSTDNNFTQQEKLRNIWNSLNEKKCNEFAKYLKDTDFKKYKKIMQNLHDQFTKDWWDNERELILQGKGTRNWTTDQQKIILNINKKNGQLLKRIRSISIISKLSTGLTNN